jgi:hypothetical protein
MPCENKRKSSDPGIGDVGLPVEKVLHHRESEYRLVSRQAAKLVL